MRKVAVVGAGAGGAAAVAELVAAGHEVGLWSRSPETLAAFQGQGGVCYEGVLGSGLARPKLMTSDLPEAIDAADVILVCLPTFAHADIARALAHAGTKVPVVLNPGHTGGALEFQHAFHALGAKPPRRVPRWLARLAAGEMATVMMTESRGSSNAKAKRELGWEPRYPSWRQGFAQGLG